MATFQEIAEEFQAVDAETRLDLLFEAGQNLPPLPEDYARLRDAGMAMVHECQSPVFLLPQLEDGVVRVHADVPEQAPTARGFTALLVEAFDGRPPKAVEEAPDDALHTLGLAGILGTQRTRGLRAIYARLHHAVREAVEKAAE